STDVTRRSGTRKVEIGAAGLLPTGYIRDGEITGTVEGTYGKDACRRRSVMNSAGILRRWAALGRSGHVDTPAVDWKPVSRMIAAAERDAKGAQKDLKRLLERSATEAFPGFGDPLGLNLDFAGCREEFWSDWLGWILQGMDSH